MKIYRVNVGRAYWHSGSVEIEAENEEQAQKLALLEIDNTSLSISHIIPAGAETGDSAEVEGEVGL